MTKPLPLPPLQVGREYLATEFDHLEFFLPLQGQSQDGQIPMFRVHLKNGTIIGLPTTVADMRHWALLLTEAFGHDVIAHLKSRKWI